MLQRAAVGEPQLISVDVEAAVAVRERIDGDKTVVKSDRNLVGFDCGPLRKTRGQAHSRRRSFAQRAS